jgi:hypothetical protein
MIGYQDCRITPSKPIATTANNQSFEAKATQKEEKF